MRWLLHRTKFLKNSTTRYTKSTTGTRYHTRVRLPKNLFRTAVSAVFKHVRMQRTDAAAGGMGREEMMMNSSSTAGCRW